MADANGFVNAETAVRAWRDFAQKLLVAGPSGSPISWADYLKKYPQGRADERTIVGPRVFPAFAEEILEFEVGRTLAPELSGAEGRPDFTPADAVTHPFVFEVKGTDGRDSLEGHEEQVTRYLAKGHDRIKRVVLTNLYGLRVFERDATSQYAIEVLKVNLRMLALIPLEHAVTHAEAQVFAEFVNEHRFKSLSLVQKIQRVREAPSWNPELEVTDPSWVLSRLDSVVEAIREDVNAKVREGQLLDSTVLLPADRPLVERELRELDMRVGSDDKDAARRGLRDYVNAGTSSKPWLALQQFVAHTAFYTATRLLLVRAWEDSGLLSPAVLYDGGFDSLMTALETVAEVVETAFTRAGRKYPDLFARHTALSWYKPSEDVYVNAVYDLANTYLGTLSDDILGEVYERQLARVDRKQLGQYYTPRDIIKLIWDMVDIRRLAEAADDEERPVRVLDIATGSGGFLVAASSALRGRYDRAREAGATVGVKSWLADVTDGLVGCEIQQFSAYLAEVNLVLQLSPLLRQETDLRLPALRIHCADTLTLHNPDETSLIGAIEAVSVSDHSGVQTATEIAERQESLDRVRDPYTSGEWLDAAVGNPPYIGEKSIAATLADLRNRHPYWRQFSAIRQDYLYYFLILGVSKLRKGGRFGFITTEYWLKAVGAAPLRQFLAQHTRIERVVLFRDLTLFQDAPGQHNLIVIGERISDPAHPGAEPLPSSRPQISIYVGPARPATRQPSLDAIREGRNAPASTLVHTFPSRRDPSRLGGESWAEVVMTLTQITRRDAVRRSTNKAGLVMSEGVIATPQRLRANQRRYLPQETLSLLSAIGTNEGLFELTEAELGALTDSASQLTSAENDHVRAVINTRDVYPYACVLPTSPNRLIWLPTSHGGTNGEFPEDMPTLHQHLRQFKPLLESIVEGYRANRPWWSAHRARLELIEGHSGAGEWADFATMSRWGDKKLLTGLAPIHSLPLSGLHAFTGSGETSAAYLVGLINSTPVQELAEAIAPGSVSQKDIEELGLPQFSRAVAEAIETRVLSLANIVKALITRHSLVWPDIADSLREDMSLGRDVFDSWIPVASRRNWGTLASVNWVRIEGAGTVSGTVEGTELTDDLLGTHLVVNFSRGRIRVDVDEHQAHDLRVLLQAMVRGLGRATPPKVLAMPVPISADTLVADWQRNHEEVTMLIGHYQQLRNEIDAIVLDALEHV